MYKLRKISGLTEDDQNMISEMLEKRGDEIKEAWKPHIKTVRDAIAGNSKMTEYSIDRILENVAEKVDIPVDDGGTDAGARGRQAILNILAEIMPDEIKG